MAPPPFFTIAIDNHAKIVRMTLRGAWTRDVMMDFHEARSKMIAQLGKNMNEYSCLSDVRDQAILPADLAELERASIAKLDFKPKKLAYLVGSSIKNFQAHRVANLKIMHSFSNYSEALEWLTTGGD